MENEQPLALSKRIAALERQLGELAEMATLVATHRAAMLMLVGWSEIERYCRKKRRTLSRYTKELAFPAYRFGRHTVSSPLAIDNWLMAKAAVRKKHRECARKTQKGKERIREMSDSALKARIQ